MQDTKAHNESLKKKFSWLLYFQSSISRILKLLGALHEMKLHGMDDVTKRLVTDEAGLAEHGEFLDRYSTIVSDQTRKSLPEMQTALSGLRSAQLSLERALAQVGKRRDMLVDNAERLWDALSMGQRMRKLSETCYEHVEAQQRANRQRIESFRQQCEVASRQLAQMLSKSI